MRPLQHADLAPMLVCVSFMQFRRALAIVATLRNEMCTTNIYHCGCGQNEKLAAVALKCSHVDMLSLHAESVLLPCERAECSPFGQPCDVSYVKTHTYHCGWQNGKLDGMDFLFFNCSKWTCCHCANMDFNALSYNIDDVHRLPSCVAKQTFC